MFSLLNKAPALLVLEAIVLAVVCRGQGLSFALSIVISDLFILSQALIAESRWSARRALFMLFLCAVAVWGSLSVTKRLELREQLPLSVSSDFTLLERRRLGEVHLLLLKDARDEKWISVAKGALAEGTEGDRFRFVAAVRALRENTARSSFSPFRYWKARGVRGELRDIREMKPLPSKLSIHTIRQSLRERMLSLPSVCRALSSAVLLGDREPAISEDFRRWGISHYLAVSGWHVGFALVLAGLLMRKNRFRFLLASLFLWAYCGISGMSNSAVRAAIMLQASLLGAATGNGTSGLNCVGLAGVLMLLYDPWVCYDLGWQLSVLAAATVIILQRFKSVWGSLLTSPLMWLIASPLVAPNAGGLFLSSLPINAMATALFSFILIFTVVASLPLMLGIGLLFPALCVQQLFQVWSQAADQWVRWLPFALPAGYFPVWLCGGIFYLLLALSLKIRVWRAAFLALTGGFMLHFLSI